MEENADIRKKETFTPTSQRIKTTMSHGSPCINAAVIIASELDPRMSVLRVPTHKREQKLKPCLKVPMMTIERKFF